MIEVDGGRLLGGLVAGIIGAAIGTIGFAAVRSRLATVFGRNLPAALIEDQAVRKCSISRIGGAPNIREYSRLNCEALSYPT
jgi:uncharacterized membrane protein